MRDINEYILISIYIFVSKNGNDILCRIYKKIYFVDNLKIHVFIKNDVINLEKIVLNVNQSKIYIDNYNIIITIINQQRKLY